MSRFSREDQSFLGRWWWTIDRPLLFAFALLMIIGIMLVATASPAVAEHHNLGSFHFLIKHIIFLIISFVIFIGFSMATPKMVWRISSAVLIASLIGLCLVLAIGMEIKGARRWLHMPGFSLQPSEFVKPSFVIVSAWLMSLQKSKNFPGNSATAVLYALIVVLLIMEPDLGMTVLVTAGWAALIFIAGLRFRLMIVLSAIAVIGMTFAYFTLDHVNSRMNRFLNPDSGDTYQIERSIEAIQAGGIMGVGPGQGEVKLKLPDGHADFIFSIAAEEMGLGFVAILIFLYGFIIFRGMNKLIQNNDMFSVLAAGGLLTIFALQAFVHMGSAMSILPAKGMTLPFISYGGSSLISMGYAMGVVMALTKKTPRASVSKGGLSSSGSQQRFASDPEAL